MQIQDRETYRRGIVLGLTMAEIVILVLFCLLMALTLIFKNQGNLIKEQKIMLHLHQQRIAELEDNTPLEADPATLRLVAILKEYWERYKPSEKDDRHYFSELILQVQDLKNLKKELEELKEHNTIIENDLKVTKKEMKKMTQSKGEHDWPPIITLTEADGYHFETGSAKLSDSFKKALSSSVIPRLIDIIELYNVDVIEILGHTDEQPVTRCYSNLDDTLRKVFINGENISSLVPGDNAGLGLARAVSVSLVLSSDKRILPHMKILPFSGAQLVERGDKLTDWSFSGPVKERRRIEIRVRRSQSVK